MKNSKIKLYLVLVGILFIFVLYFSLKDNYKDILDALKNVNILFLLIGVFFVFLSKYFLGETMYFLTKKEKSNIRMKDMLLIQLIYPFFAGITPSSLGGESFEILYLKDCGVPVGKGSNVAIQKFLTYQISLILVNMLAVIVNLIIRVVPLNSFIFTCILINFVVNIVLLAFFFLLTYNKKFNHFIMKKGLVLGHKLHIIRDIGSTREKLDSYLKNFDEGVDNLRSDKKLFIKLIAIQMISLLFLILAAYPVAISLDITNINFVKMFVMATHIKMISLLLITPGNSGAAEYSFVYIFTGLIADADIMAFMLIWRVVTYYIPLIAGGIFAMTWGRRKHTYE